jgi:hypothetical protein
MSEKRNSSGQRHSSTSAEHNPLPLLKMFRLEVGKKFVVIVHDGRWNAHDSTGTTNVSGLSPRV